MSTISAVADECQHLLTEAADELARECGFVVRDRKLSGSAFVQALVFTWADRKDASIAKVVEHLRDCGIEIDEESIRKRFNEKGSQFLRAMIEKTLSTAMQARSEAIPLLKRFNGVYLEDCSTITMPADLAELFCGCGGSKDGGAAGVKIFTCVEVGSGAVTKLTFWPSRQNDVLAGQQAGELPVGSLRVADLGFFDVKTFQRYTTQGVYWISRGKTGVLIEPEGQTQQKLNAYLQSQSRDQGPIDVAVRLTQRRMPCRLVAIPCTEQVAAKRKRQLRQRMKKKGQTVSAEQLVLCEWTVYFTNLPVALASVDDIYVLYGVRWQIELVFKRWKSVGGLAMSRGRKGYRVLCEFYAKLLGMLLLNWVLLLTGGALAKRSVTGALQIACENAVRLLEALMMGTDVTEVIARIVRKIKELKPRKRRRKRPSTRQVLYAQSLKS